MKNITIKLASNFQTIEFQIDNLMEDLTPAIDLINSLGKKVINSANGGKTAKTEESDAPSEAQIKRLKELGFDPSKFNRTQAWAVIRSSGKK